MVWFVVLCTVGALLLIALAVVMSIVERVAYYKHQKRQKEHNNRNR